MFKCIFGLIHKLLTLIACIITGIFRFFVNLILKIIAFSKRKKLERKANENGFAELYSLINGECDMGGIEFENYIAKLLENEVGSDNVDTTPVSSDYGVDIITTVPDVSVYQCKCYSGTVGVKAVQEVYSGKAYYNADNAYVVTNSTFTKNARELAEKTGVILWDRDSLLNLIDKY